MTGEVHFHNPWSKYDASDFKIRLNFLDTELINCKDAGNYLVGRVKFQIRISDK